MEREVQNQTTVEKVIIDKYADILYELMVDKDIYPMTWENAVDKDYEKEVVTYDSDYFYHVIDKDGMTVILARTDSPIQDEFDLVMNIDFSKRSDMREASTDTTITPKALKLCRILFGIGANGIYRDGIVTYNKAYFKLYNNAIDVNDDIEKYIVVVDDV